MKRILIFLIISLISANIVFAQKNKNLSVTYVGNAGFMYQIGEKKILIDALFKGFQGDYILPQHIQEKLIKAEAPFDNIDLILVTHAHGDHINVSMVNQHMKNNPKAIFVSTKQTVDALNARDTMDNFHERRMGFDPTKDKSDKNEISGISIETFLFPHGPESRIINIGFLISVNGVKIFQTGDFDFDQYTFEEFKKLQLAERKIDLAFIQHYYLRGVESRVQFIKEGIAGKHIFPIHYQFTTPSFNADSVIKYYPEAIIFDKELESKKIILNN